ncbi:MAG: hypothetical protein EAZ41_07400 [Sphingobacteriia bacterium]|nr:MAG: hypothetical protein EAZ41_07400 [Sphingobacteriia bacterium]
MPNKLFLLFLLSFSFQFSYAQQSDTSYTQQWNEIDSLMIIQQLPKSALAKINELYIKAKNEKQSAQIIKCKLYQLSLEEQISDPNPNSSILILRKEIVATSDPVQLAILQTILAKQYLKHYNEARWMIFQRKKNNAVNKDDINTWTADDFEKTVDSLFQFALMPAYALQQVNTRFYHAIILKGSDSTHPNNLFDLISAEAIEYYQQSYIFSRTALRASKINDTRTLASADIFMEADFTGSTLNSNTWKAVRLYQQRLRNRKNDSDKTLFIQVNMERIKWINSIVSFPQKERIYEASLLEITSQYPLFSASIQAWYLLAEQYFNRARSYNPLADTTNRYAYNKSLEYIDAAKKIYAKEVWEKSGLYRLQVQILGKKSHTEVEKINAPNTSFRALVHYRNTDTLYARIIKIDPKKLLRNNYTDEYWKIFTSLNTFKVFSQALPPTNDHQAHSVEIKIDGLANGNYLLLTSTSKEFIPQKEDLSASFFNISNLTYFRENNRVFVRELTNGKAVSNAAVTIYSVDRTNYQSTKINGSTEYKTDEKGSFKFAFSSNYRQYYLFEIKKRKEYLFFDELENINLPYDNLDDGIQKAMAFEKNTKRIFFFTDRSLYRPGQLVYFKGIAITKDYTTKRSKLVIDKNPLTVFLKDVNGKRVDSAVFSLNEYGSFAGQFKLPQQLLTGQFSIELPEYNQSATYFAVEEYKLPKFSVVFNKSTKSHPLNDSLHITGSATAYAGNAINGGKVVYTIRQNSSVISPFNKSIYPPSSDIEIVSGETITDEKGNFTIAFKAGYDEPISDLEINLYYHIEATITDLNGESITSITTANASNATIKLSIQNSMVIEKNAFKHIIATAFNNNGYKENTAITISLLKTKTPETAIRKRYWSKPDQFLFTEPEYHQYFPYDEYNNEMDQSGWPLTLLMQQTKALNTDTIAIQDGIIEAGVYKIMATATDSLGKKINSFLFVAVYDSALKKIPFPTYQFHTAVSSTAKPGDTAVFMNGTSFTNIPIIRKIKREYQKSDEYSYFKAGTLEALQFVPQEKDRGNIIITDAYVYHGRFYTNQYRVMVPFTNKQLQIKYSTHRSSYEPGSKEKFSLEVSGENSVQQAAELLTGMYDASLDAIKPHGWFNPNIWESLNWSSSFVSNLFAIGETRQNGWLYPNIPEDYFSRNILAASGEELWNGSHHEPFNRGMADTKIIEIQRFAFSTKSEEGIKQKSIQIRGVNTISNSEKAASLINGEKENGVVIEKDEAGMPPEQIRKNFNETAFFFPQLQADSTGKFSFNFTLPDAVSKWKWMSIAHTKDLAFGSNSETILTQKILMVQPNAPRFLREGDRMEFSTKIANLSNKELTGTITLELLDAATNKSVDGWFQNVFPQQYFTSAAGQSAVVKFPIQIPYSFNKPLIWRIVARADHYSDGEENTIPVLTNRQLVTESLPIFLQKDTTRIFSFTKLLNNKSESLVNQSLTVEYTTNPIWNAVQALPYLMEYPYECAEQNFNRLYANLLGAYIVDKNTRIKSIFAKWKNDSSALISQLEKNETLKQVILQETPWVLEAENEARQKQQIALLFNAIRLEEQTDKWILELEQLQLTNGGFPWFKGGNTDKYITNYILTGIGKLKRLGALSPNIALRLRPILVKAIQFMDQQIANDFKELKLDKNFRTQQSIYGPSIEYLFMRSFFSDIANQSAEAHQFFYDQGKKYWNKQNTYYQAMLALIYHRNKEEKMALQNILPSLLEQTIVNPEQGMYWKTTYANSWYQSPIIHQAMMISCFIEINEQERNKATAQSINAMRNWLILNKQTNHWNTTIATADVCYAILLNGSDWLNSGRTVNIQLGKLNINGSEENKEAGSSYFKKRIDGAQVIPEMGNIKITVKTAEPSTQPSYGAVHWKYFEDLDKITPAASPLLLSKELLVERKDSTGKTWMVLKENEAVKIGAKIMVRMVLKADRDMEYLHLKDLRAAATEPMNTLSGYKWQEALGYYESTKDVSSNFFISFLPKGSYIFTYELMATHMGDFSVGIGSIQSMYAPEFSSHSSGIRLRVVE